jgi:GNAT superfamily N-acetyltransferase
MARPTNVKRDHKRGRAAAYEQIIDAREKITLSPVDWDIFYNALIDPPAPNRNLKAAARRYASGSVDELTAIEPLAPHHDRASFSCGEPALDNYLQRQASQGVRRVAKVFVAVGATPGRVAGYYTLSAAEFDKAELPAAAAKRLPHYPVPAAVLGRLAVDRSHQGRGLGETLLMDAIRRTLRASEAVAVLAIIVDAKHQQAKAFYERYGFRSFATAARRIFLPLETFEKLDL